MKVATIRMKNTMLERVDSPAKSGQRSRTRVINQAVERFLNYEEWYISEIEAGIKEVEADDFTSKEEVAWRFAGWNVNAN